jgi:nucleoside-diphosphate-sugar epimerase
VREDGPLRGEGNPYCQTKIESERCIQSFNDPGRMGVIVIRPGDVYGAGSVPWVSRPVEMMRKGIFALPGRGQGYMNHVYVDNLVDGILLAVEQRAFGQAFNLTDGRRTTNLDYFMRLAAAAKVSKPRLVPSGAFYAVGALGSLLSRVGVEKLDVGIDTVRYLLRPGVYSIEKARSTLGYRPVIALDEGMSRVSESLR